MATFVLTGGNDAFPGPEDVTGSDRIEGLGGDDTVLSGGGDDTVLGGDGNDLIYGQLFGIEGPVGFKWFYGGLGDDLLVQTGPGLGAFLEGGAGNDTLALSTGEAYGGEGDDRIFVGTTDALADGGTGRDRLAFALSTNAVLRFDGSGPQPLLVVDGSAASGSFFGFEAFEIEGYWQDDVLTGGDGDDALSGNLGNDLVRGGDGNDTLSGETVHGGGGDDVFEALSSTNRLAHDYFGGSGNDTIDSNLGRLKVEAGSGDDLVRVQDWEGPVGTETAAVLEGGAGRDGLDLHLYSISAASGLRIDMSAAAWTATLNGGAYLTAGGFETLSIRASAFELRGSAGNDVVEVSGGRGGLDMGAGNDLVRSRAGADRISGGDGNDTLLSGGGDDTVTGGAGRDYIGAGTGRDVIVYTALSDSGTAFGAGQIDQINFFQPGRDGDRIDLTAIDARAGDGGHQLFEFIGSAAFTAEGQVRVVQGNGGTFVQVNTMGAGGSDMTLSLPGVSAADITAGNFDL